MRNTLVTSYIEFPNVFIQMQSKIKVSSTAFCLRNLFVKVSNWLIFKIFVPNFTPRC